MPKRRFIDRNYFWAWFAFALFVLWSFCTIFAVAQVSGEAKRLADYDLVRSEFFRVVVNGDTLAGERFTSLYTAERFLRDYADTAFVGANSGIIGANYDFRTKYEDIEEGELSSLLLRDVNWQHAQSPDSTSYTIRLVAKSIADSVLFHYVGFDSTALILDAKSLKVPSDGLVRDTLRSDFTGTISVYIEAYYGTSFVEDSLIIDISFISSLDNSLKKKTIWQFRLADIALRTLPIQRRI